MNRVDANVVLRYLLDDHAELSEKATQIIENERLHLSFEVMCEIVYVLLGVYKVSRSEIVELLKTLLERENVDTTDSAISGMALDLFMQKNVDFVDALLCAYHQKRADRIFTFDKKIESIIHAG